MDGVPKLLLLLVVTATVTSHGDHDHSADSKQHIMEHLEQAIGGTYNDLQVCHFAAHGITGGYDGGPTFDRTAKFDRIDVCKIEYIINYVFNFEDI